MVNGHDHVLQFSLLEVTCRQMKTFFYENIIFILMKKLEDVV